MSGFIRPPFRLRRNRAGRSSAPPGPLFCRSRHGCAAPGPQRQNPGACRRSAPFRLRETVRPVVAPAGGNVLAAHFRFAQMWPRIFPRGLPGYVPLFHGWPRARTPALVAVRLHFAARNRAGRSLPPPGATCSLPHFRSAQMWPRIFPRGLPGYVPLFHGWPRARTPALVAVRLHFAARNRAGRSLPPPGATCSLPHFRSAQMWPRIFPRGLPGYVPLFPGWPRARTPALVAVRLHFAARNRAGRSLPPPGATCSLPHFRFAQMWPRARTPALSSVSS